MKRKVVNEKVIRAMAIGISAMLATATPMTVMAAEGEGDNPEAPQAGGSEAEVNIVVDDAQAAGKSAEAGVEAAEKPVETVTGDVETQVVTGEAGTDAEGKDLAQTVIDAAADLAGDATGNDLTKADTNIKTTDVNLDAAEGAIVSSDSSLAKAEEAYDDASDAANEAVKAVTEANEAIDAKAGDISNAETIDEANAAYDELVAIADEAEETFNTKLEEYNEAKSAYESAAADVEKYEQAYADAVDLADKNAEAALKDLEAAKEKAVALEEALQAAKASVDESAAAAIAIADKEKEVDSAGLNWKEEDKLFILIMENYYLPENNISGAKVTRVQGKDNDEYNYFKAVYTDETGKKCEKYFNFKLGENNKTKNEMIIFEKREVEIFGDPNETPDRYVDSTGAVKNIDKGLKDGSIIAVVTDNGDGTQSTKYFETAKLGNATVGDVIESTEVTNESKVDITVDKTTAKEEYKFDDEGNLVKEVKADVTTITYTEASFISKDVYDSESARDDAADDEKAKLEAAGAKNVKVNETEDTTYVVTGTYIPTFTKTVNVNKEYESKDDWWDIAGEAENGQEAKEKAYNSAKNQIDNDLGEYYRIGDIKSDLSVSMTEEESVTYKDFWGNNNTIVTNDSDYLVKGTVEVTYAKVTKETVDQSTLEAIWEDIKSRFEGSMTTNDKLKEAARAKIEADGGIFIGADWFDGKINKATIRYVKAEKVVSDECDSVEKAEASLAAKIRAQLGSATGTYNEIKNTESETKYSFDITYLEKSTPDTENKVVRTETYEDAEALQGQIIQNKNFRDKIYLMTRQDKDFRDFVDNGVAITGKYAKLIDEAQAATEAVAKAQAKVDDLNEKIKDLEGSRKSNLGALEDLSVELATAERNLAEAKGNLEKIKDKLEDAGVELEDVIERLTPAPGTPGTPGAPATEDGAPGEGPATVVTTTTTTTAATNLALAGAGNAGGANVGNAGNAGDDANAGAGGIVNIDDEETALAASVDDVDDTANVVEIGDEETPLAASVDNETMSWWWLLLIALLGATGYEMYRKHQQKKEALAETDDVQ